MILKNEATCNAKTPGQFTAKRPGQLVRNVHLKIDSAGNLEWQKSLGGNDMDWGNYGIQSSDGGFVIAGYTSSSFGDVTGYHGGSFWGDYWIVKLDESGNLFSQKCLGGTGDDVAASVEEASDGAFIVSGWSQSNDGDVSSNDGVADYWLVSLSVPTNANDFASEELQIIITPNPVSDRLNIQVQLSARFSNDIKIQITDITGKVLSERFLESSFNYLNESFNLDSNFPEGIYLVSILTDKQRWARPFVVQR